MTRQIPGIIATLLWLLAAGGCSDPVETDDAAAMRFDILIRGGLVFDGSGAAPQRLDVGVTGDRIVFVGDAAGAAGETIIDAEGLWVTPGFIDAHSHAELDEPWGRDALPYLYQGVTTVVLGLDGSGTAEVADRLGRWRDNGIGTNGLLFVGHGAVRREVMGLEDREPTPDELASMQELVARGMDEGAFGLSTGLFYVPGAYASTEEVIELARVAARYPGAIYDTHDRDLGAVYQGVGYDASVAEAIRIGEASGLPVVFSHYNLQGAHNYGRGDDAARYVNDARSRGLEVWAAQHPYTATQSNLRAYTIPNWAASGGQESMIARFDDADTAAEIVAATEAMLEIRGGADKILFADPRPELNGKTLAEVAAERELDPAHAVQDILRSGNAVVMNLELYDDANTRRLAMEPWMMTCTDGRTPRPDQVITHPRTFGAFPKKMRMLALDDALAPAEFVIRSFSGLAADFYGLADRGYLRDGYLADIVVLDPESYRDTATFDRPQSYATGVREVLVNGVFAVRGGEASGALAGRPLTRD
jgi:N-acyl-D-amino-acid deacylase